MRNIWRPRQDTKPMMNTRATRRDFEDEITPDTGEQRQTGSVLDELIECQLREISNQNNLQIQHTERFNEIVSQYEERIGSIEGKQEQIIATLQNLTDSISALAKGFEAIENKSKVWDWTCEDKFQAAQAELTTRVFDFAVKEVKSFDARTGEYIRRLETETQELSTKIERLGMETASLKESLATYSAEKPRRSVHAEPRVSTPMPVHRSYEAWPGNQLTQSIPGGKTSSTMRDGNLIRKPNMYDGQTSWEAYYAQFCIIAEMNGWGETQKAAFLATSLKGTALQVLANLSIDR